MGFWTKLGSIGALAGGTALTLTGNPMAGLALAGAGVGGLKGDAAAGQRQDDANVDAARTRGSQWTGDQARGGWTQADTFGDAAEMAALGGSIGSGMSGTNYLSGLGGATKGATGGMNHVGALTDGGADILGKPTVYGAGATSANSSSMPAWYKMLGRQGGR